MYLHFLKILQLLLLLLLLMHHLLLVLFLDHDILYCIFCYFNWVWCIYSNLGIGRAHRRWLSRNNPMSLNTWYKKWVSFRTFKIFTCTNTYFWCARLLFIIQLLQRKITHMFVFWKYNTSLTVSRIFISAILLLILWRIYRFDWRLTSFMKVSFILMKLIIIFYYLLLHADVSIYLWSAIIILICQKVRRLILVRWDLLLSLLLLEFFISVLLLHLILAFRCKLYLTSILNNVFRLYMQVFTG